MPYIFNRDTQRYEKYTKEEVIDDKIMEGFLEKYKYELENGFGYLYYDSGSVIYNDRKIKIKINKNTGVYNMTSEDIPQEGYIIKEVLLKDYYENENEKLKGNVVIYKDDKFIRFTIGPLEYFDYEKSKVVKNKQAIREKVFGSNFNEEVMIRNIRERGFSYVVNGNIYYQPFNNMEDVTYFTSLLSYRPQDRIMKAYIHRDIEDSSKNDYRILEGVILTDDFINNILIYFKYFNFYIKDITLEYYNTKIDNEDDIDKLYAIKSSYIDDIVKIIYERYIGKTSVASLSLGEVEKLVFTEKEKLLEKATKETKEEEKKENKPSEESKKEESSKSSKEEVKEEKAKEPPKEEKKEEKPKETVKQETKEEKSSESSKEEKKDDKEKSGSKAEKGKGPSIGFDKDWNSLFAGDEDKLVYGTDGKAIKKN